MEVNSTVSGSTFSDKSLFSTPEIAYSEGCKSLPTSKCSEVHLTVLNRSPGATFSVR